MFGTELRRRRIEAALSLNDLARLVHYSKSHLSKVETGAKPASIDLARQCDAALSAGGSLSRLVASGACKAAAGARLAQVQMLADRSEVEQWVTASRDMLPDQVREPTLQAFRSIFDELRRLGQWTEPGSLAAAVLEQARFVGSLAENLDAVGRDDALGSPRAMSNMPAGWRRRPGGTRSR